MDLNHLLDNDYLTPAQERFIRKSLESYRLERKPNSNFIIVFFKIKGMAREKSTVYLSEEFLNNKNSIYKDVMYWIVSSRARTVKTEPLIHELTSLIEKSEQDTEFKTIAVYTKFLKSKFPKTYKSQDLYKAIEIIKEYGAL